MKANGVEPELGFHVFPFNVDMGRLVPIAGVEEKPKALLSVQSAWQVLSDAFAV